MSDEDPVRWSDGHEEPLIGEALLAARSDVPTSRDLARLADRLPLVGPSGGGGGAGGASEAVASSLPAPAKLGALAALALGVVIGAALLRPAPGPSPAKPAAAVTAVVPVVAEAFPSPRESAQPIGAIVAPTPTAGPVASDARMRPAVPVSAVTAPSPATVSTTPIESAPPIASAAENTETEVQLLARAQQELGANPARALALTEEAARRWPTGSLGQEREVLAISALVRMGRSGDARARAEAFAKRFPRSAHVRRLATIVPGFTAPEPP